MNDNRTKIWLWESKSKIQRQPLTAGGPWKSGFGLCPVYFLINTHTHKIDSKSYDMLNSRLRTPDVNISTFYSMHHYESIEWYPNHAAYTQTASILCGCETNIIMYSACLKCIRVCDLAEEFPFSLRGRCKWYPAPDRQTGRRATQDTDERKVQANCC